MLPSGMVDYRKFRLRLLNTPAFSHLKLILFWPLFGLAFFLVERVLPMEYHVIHCALDDLIPFWEWMIVPYLFWFVFLAGMLLYALLFDPESFRKAMWFIILTFGATIVIYLIYPSAQELRPASFERDNFITRFMVDFYAFDTNTNVCPSLHVTGAVAVLACAWHMPRLQTVGWRVAFSVATFLISVSTVFIKQHSVIDLIAAVVLCAIVWPLVYCRKKKAIV